MVIVVFYCLSMASMQCIYPVSKYLAQVRLKIFFFCEKIPICFPYSVDLNKNCKQKFIHINTMYLLFSVLYRKKYSVEFIRL